MSYEQESSRRDHLTSTSKDGKIELTQEQLSRVGGAAVYMKWGSFGSIKWSGS